MVGVDFFFSCFFFSWKYFRACHIRTLHTIKYAAVVVLLHGFVLVQQQYLNLGGKPVTVKVVFRKLERFLSSKWYKTATAQNMGYSGTYVCDTIVVCVITLFVCPLEADIYPGITRTQNL